MSNKVRQIVECRTLGREGHETSAAARKCVLLAMADRADDEGWEVFLSKGSLAAITELSKSTVKKAINELCSDQLILEDGTRQCTGGATINYRLNITAIESLPLNTYGERQADREGGRRLTPLVPDAHIQGGRRLTPPGPEANPLGGRRLTPNHPLNHPETIRGPKAPEEDQESLSHLSKSEREHHEKLSEILASIAAAREVSKLG